MRHRINAEKDLSLADRIRMENSIRPAARRNLAHAASTLQGELERREIDIHWLRKKLQEKQNADAKIRLFLEINDGNQTFNEEWDLPAGELAEYIEGCRGSMRVIGHRFVYGDSEVQQG